MAVRPVLGSALSCGSCRSNLLCSFIAASGIEVATSRERFRWQRPRTIQPSSGFSQQFGRLQIRSEADAFTESPSDVGVGGVREEDIETAQEEPEKPAENPTSSQPYVPWYLQVEPAAIQQESPRSDRQRLPDLPESPPALLQPLLEQVSVDLGMDDLSLLDLRTLDPPPALGSSVIMIIGTARSEKHLHVSADRLCRWLRSTYGLSPFADGLLGRNELKLKMRRKAKRQRMMSAVGAKETGGAEIDDGLRTGWVCVNVGRVDGGELETAQNEEIQGFVGFGSSSGGSRLVVQMMTDEKRGQIDLESLWNGILRRSKKAQGEEQDQTESAEDSVTVGSQEPSKSSFSRFNQSGIAGDTRFSRNLQARAFHTSARRLRSSTDDPATTMEPPSATLLSMIADLKTVDRTSAIEQLGSGENDQDSTPFLRSFYRQLPTWPALSDWQAYLGLVSHAIRIGHPGYTPAFLINIIHSMRAACIQPTREDFLVVLSALLEPETSPASASKPQQLSRQALLQAHSIYESMHEYGYEAPPPSYLHRLQTLSPYVPTPAPIVNPTAQIAASEVAAPEPTTISSALSAGFFNTAWDLWAAAPRNFLPRSAEQYASFLHSMADTGHQREVARALRKTVPAMAREVPRVEIRGEVAEAVGRCLKVVEPELGTRTSGWGLGGTGEGGKGEWEALWVRVQRGIDTEKLEREAVKEKQKDTEKEETKARPFAGGFSGYFPAVSFSGFSGV